MSWPSVHFARAASPNVGIATDDAAENRISSSDIVDVRARPGRPALIQRCCLSVALSTSLRCLSSSIFLVIAEIRFIIVV